jgi:hypothetical protein
MKEAAERAKKEEEARRAAELAAAENERRAEAERKQRQKQEAEAEAQKKAARRSYLSSLDHSASRYCNLSVDPQQRHFKGGVSADWGQVVRKTAVEVPPANALAEPQLFTVYEIAGVAKHHFLRSDRAGKLSAEVGDLFFLCHPYGNSDRHLPPPWDKVPLVSPNYNGRIATLPLIAKKGKWNPIQVTLNDLFWAIKEVKWKFPEDRYVLAELLVGEELDHGRFLIPADDPAITFVLEVPPGLARRELMKKEEWVWVIMGHPRFDPQQKKLVLVAADIESRYLIEPQ